MQVTGYLAFMIKKWQIGDQIQVHNRGELEIIQKLLLAGFGPPSKGAPNYRLSTKHLS
jgi:hypothetical protein